MATRRQDAKVLEAFHELTQAGRHLEERWEAAGRSTLDEVRRCLQVLRKMSRREVRNGRHV
jgi:hypothetical protein